MKDRKRRELPNYIFLLIFFLLTFFILIIESKENLSDVLPKEMKNLLKRCEFDHECADLTCPQIAGLDTPRCIEGVCLCGPKADLNLSRSEWLKNICLELEKIVFEVLLKEEKIDEKYEHTEEELERIREKIKEFLNTLEKNKILERVRKINETCFKRLSRNLTKEENRKVVRESIEMIREKYRAEKRNLTKNLTESILELNKIKKELILYTNLTGKELAEEIRKINEIKKEIIRDYIERLKELNFEKNRELKELLKEIKVGKRLEVFNETLNVTKVITKIKNKTYEIEAGENITIRYENLEIKSKISLKLRENSLEDAETGKEIVFTPEFIRGRFREKIREVFLDRKNNEIVYKIRSERSGRLLGLIPIRFNSDHEISAETGKEISVRRPWWSFLVV